VAISERDRAGHRLVLERGCAAGVRAAEVAGGASHGGEVFWQEEASGDGQEHLAKRKGLHINCEFYRLNVNLRARPPCTIENKPALVYSLTENDTRSAHIADLIDDLADLYMAQVADLREFAQSTEAGEGTMHLEDALRHREIRRGDLYRQFEHAAFSPPPISVVAPNELDLPEDN
jgi:hypothetical protein